MKQVTVNIMNGGGFVDLTYADDFVLTPGQVKFDALACLSDEFPNGTFGDVSEGQAMRKAIERGDWSYEVMA